ncbi:MAG TPA: CoB--CoM heterodisulfide reductase iron-sulfur subunit A family protein [Candidatus Lokiarchaeia archaeon]|nr:CoB--CoM heterodisulfide reductase iron-sulfur subunit A family protein [Candidatus Lokiarchaeia archaeon]
MLEVGRNPQIKLHTLARVTSIKGQVGNFELEVLHQPKYVTDKCNGCLACVDHCPAWGIDAYNEGFSHRKAIYKAFAQAVPSKVVIDMVDCVRCGTCINICEQDAINLNEEPRTEVLNVGTIAVATGWDEYRPTKGYLGYGVYDNVITQMEFERLLAPNGPYLGHFARPSDNKVPKSVLFVQCVGSRDIHENAYCSAGVCCMVSVKNSKLIKQEDPDVDVAVAYIDMRCAGKMYEEYFRDAREYGVRFVPSSVSKVKELPDKSLEVTLDVDEPVQEVFDLVILSCAIKPSKTANLLNQVLGLQQTPDGFFKEYHARLNPIDSPVPGIAYAGVSQGPKSIAESIMQARGAASSLGTIMHRGAYDLEMIKAVVDEDRCSRCGLCVDACPYNAIALNDEGIAVVNEVLCRGCGTCAALCPSVCIDLRNNRESQYVAVIDSLFENGTPVEE